MSIPLADLLKDVAGAETNAPMDLRVGSLAYDSRRVTPGALFFALRGEQSDGLHFAAQATELGAIAIVSDAASVSCALPFVRVPDARAAMGDIAAAFHGHPSAKLKVVAVTGTNGKTTTTFLVKHLLDADMRRCGLIGTVKYVVGDDDVEAARTTPESVDLQELMGRMVDAGCKAVAMEASSQALVQHRMRGTALDVAVFTNLTQDHLDYHKTMDAYFDAKAMLFQQAAGQTGKRCRGVVNIDDRYGRRVVERFGRELKMITFGLGVGADFRATDVRFDATGTQFHLEAKGRSYLVRLPLIGGFNVQNALAALATASGVGMELRAAVAALADAPQTPGRLERVPARRAFQIFVDYAHTDDALRNALRAVRELRPRRLIVVFGCGGDRDRAKRPLMAAAAEQFADWTIVTSDNPRSEDPEAILAEIVTGFRADRHECVTDRQAAINRAVALAGPGDIVVIAGKGHEKTQEIQGRKVPFDDVAVARWALDDKPVEVEEG